MMFQGRQHLSVDKKSKSFEEREEDYKKARDRIFAQQEVWGCILSMQANGKTVNLERPPSGKKINVWFLLRPHPQVIW